MNSLADLMTGYKLSEAPIKDERRALLKELTEKTGYKIGYLLFRLKGMQKVEDLRFILSAMANVPKAKDARHAFNTVLFIPKEIR